MRHEFPKAVRAAAFLRCGGRCEHCGVKLVAGGYELDHVVACGIAAVAGGDNGLSNSRVLCRSCHRDKTTEDVKRIAKAKRIERKRLGLVKPKGRPIPGSKRSGWKKKLNGTVERR